MITRWALIALIGALLAAFAPLASSAHAQTNAEDSSTLAPFFALQEQDQRVFSIGHRLLSANTDYCSSRVTNFGFQLHSLDQYGDPSAAQSAFGLVSGYPSISALVQNGAAERAGLQKNDVILAVFAQGRQIAWPKSGIGPHRVTQGNYTIWPTSETEQSELAPAIMLARMLANRPLKHEEITFAVQRNGEQIYLPVKPDITCATRFQLESSRKRRAATDGELITITTKLVEITRNDEELAAILAHELAHNFLQHPDKLTAAGVDRGLLGQLGSSAGKIKATEIEADRLSVWLMANAGFDPEGAIRFWTFFGKKYGKGIFSAPTHYRWKKRVRLFEEEIAAMATAERDENGLLPPPLLLSGGAEID
ncbi:M48 family metallopeptidase [Alterisphingorhabdus coralli]|uniref:M48 family metallopeptidase n=1 Tax=Alterisphingorhabdus coralli TaxID=3071408 RepID=A0AA97F996_9SPHN|nr:M48 family metallopeptidase [Parasphingorhabdus sp. SCSIO 66989]WOE74830.1 M48 family metallopeptidase [Parasphingorhabdus sp. SCSIO 66989]